MEIDQKCPGCGEMLHMHMEKLSLWTPGWIKRSRRRFTGWYECVSCGRRYVSVTLKRFLPSHVRND